MLVNSRAARRRARLERVQQRRSPLAGKVLRAPRRRLDLEVRREQLLAAAFELFVSRGYEEVGIEDVARAAGASKGLVYHYFPTKKDLYRAAVERGAAILLERIRTLQDAPPLERLATGLDAYFAYVAEHEMAYAALMGSGVGVDPEVAAVVERTRDEIATLLLSGLPVSEPDATLQAAVRGWIGFVEALALRWIATREPGREVLRRVAIDVLQAAVVSAHQAGPR
jgi:AcrR family transcriptional regulator